VFSVLLAAGEFDRGIVSGELVIFSAQGGDGKKRRSENKRECFHGGVFLAG
jgi:hypothetical protein